MRSIVISILAVLAIALPWGAWAQEAQEGADGPRIEWEKKAIDMGTIMAAKGKVEYEFKFVNTGDKPLVVMTAFASCDCTQPSYPTAPIAPGESGVIKVKYDPRKKAGEVTATINVITNDPKCRRSALRLEGVVVPKKKK